jgi:hypothetical protein
MRLTDFLIVDLETVGRADARKWVQPDARLVDPKKVQASIEERAEKLSLDPNGARIVCLGIQQPKQEPEVIVCRTVDEEKEAIRTLWGYWRAASHACRFVGFNARRFDLRILIQRSRYLGLDTPPISLARYGKGDVMDLFEELTFDEPFDGACIVPRSLSVFCEQFGIAVEDEHDGSEIGALVAADDWAGVVAHNWADLTKTRQLAERLGIIARVTEPVAA